MVLATPFTHGLVALGSLALAQADGARVTMTTMTTAAATTTMTAAATTTTTAGSKMTAGAAAAQSLIPGLCEARTINYITHMLPQSCLTSAWASPRPSRSEKPASTTGHPPMAKLTASSAPAPQPVAETLDSEASKALAADAAATTFMSFQDWKEMMLRQAGQDPQEWRSRKPSQYHQAGDRHPPDMGHADLGEEGEISLNFHDYPGHGDKGPTGNTAPVEVSSGKHVNEALAHGQARATPVHRGKDAGKTCKERFSYSSFDAGATILKTAAGAKNARAILVENKDTYMLLECAAPSKYIVVELSDDILVDTIVLANFEFFSSMIRHFRVSVSDRYPVKMDKWRELGTFETRNSRDIQPFLIENPQIWAKYVRIEFLTHYGTEYYCPLSLLRVHGSRMWDSWKDTETGRDEDPQVESDEASRNRLQGDATSAPAIPASEEAPSGSSSLADITTSRTVRLAGANPFDAWVATCPVSGGSRPTPTTTADRAVKPPNQGGTCTRDSASSEEQPGHAAPTPGPAKAGSSTALSAPPNSTMASAGDGETPAGSASSATSTTASGAATEPAPVRGPNLTPGPASKPSASSGKPRSSGSSGPAAAPPTVQEGFFNAITKRLQQVESNLTLSLKYVEEQSRHVQEALQRGEQKQHAKATLFLNDLNQTVLAELRNVRDQYDQMWQSTVLALESQADRSERDMMALSTRLNLLADEVVFQKRMAIVQAVILLSCLFLVIFSRGVPIPSLAPPSDHIVDAPFRRPRSASRRASHHGQKTRRSTYDDALYSLASADDDAGSPSRDTLPRARIVRAAQATSSDYQPSSPPLTPTMSDPARIPSMPASGCDSDGDPGSNPSRRLPCLSHINSRKPLPSLPEHPSSPHEL